MAEELRAGDEGFRTTFEQAAVGIAHVHPDGHWLWVNRQLCAIVGYTPDELLQRTFQDITYPPDLDADLELVRKLVAGECGSYSLEKRYVRKDGSLVWIHLIVSLVREPSGAPAYFISVVEDISSRKQVEEAASRLAAIVQSSEDAIIAKTLEGIITSWNPGAARLYGYTAEEAVGKPIAMLLPPERPDELPSIMERLRRGERVETYETQRVARDGRRIDISLSVSPVRDAAGVVVGAAAIARDITDRKRASAALERLARRLEALHEIDQAILKAQSLDTLAAAALTRLSRVVPCQHAFVALLDGEGEEVRILRAPEGQGEALPPRLRVEDLPALAALRNQAGRWRPVEVIDPQEPSLAHLLGSARGSLVAFPLVLDERLRGVLYLAACEPGWFSTAQQVIGQEIADQLAIAVQQAQLREQLQRHAEELEQRVEERTAQLQEINTALERFTYSVSHDLRAPLRAMQGIAQALLEDYGDHLDPVGQDYARRIVASSQHMDELIQDILAYSHLSRAQLPTQPLDLQAIVDEALGQVAEEVREKKAQVSVTRPLLSVVAHRLTLVQMVTNMLGNALKFVAPGVQPQVRVWAEERQGRVRLWVEDNGIGIAPAHQQRIFEVFERLHGDEEYPGTGIGLAIVRKGAERMGGRAGVESAAGEGSRFWVELPKG